MNKSTWIWYYGDFEVWQHLKVSLRREDREIIRPAFWRLDDCYRNVIFKKEINLQKEELLKITIDGIGFVTIDGNRKNCDNDISLSEGKHTLEVSVANETGLPSIFVQGETVKSDGSWSVTNYNGRWESAGYWNLEDINIPPSKFSLPTTHIFPAREERIDNTVFIDFGKQTMAKLNLTKVKGNGEISIYYGECPQEAYSKEQCTIFEKIEVNKEEYTLNTRAFRYVYIECQNAEIGEVCAQYEYLPLEYRGSFKCNNEKINKIWEMAAYTLHLNSREFFLDGIKRDRWVWAGDSFQSYRLNYYIFFDKDINKRTILALRGKEPVERHINTILDYSLYWFLGIYDYYLYTADIEFIKRIYPKMLTLMDFCLNRCNDEGLVEGFEEDWVFVDWANIDKNGAVCAVQILLCKSLEVMKLCADLIGRDGSKYLDLSKQLKEKIQNIYWDPNRGGFVDSYKDGVKSPCMTRHANIFAIFFNFAEAAQQNSIKNNVLLNNQIEAIKTPFFKFFELEALCQKGEFESVTNTILSYWGGMLDLGATSFWEEYDPNKKGIEHYAMYDTLFDKSLCHAWGGSPIYLFGKYYLGVKPTSAGYESFEITPNLGGLDWIEGVVPVDNGEIYVYMDKEKIRIKTNLPNGVLRVLDKEFNIEANVEKSIIYDKK